MSFNPTCDHEISFWVDISLIAGIKPLFSVLGAEFMRFFCLGGVLVVFSLHTITTEDNLSFLVPLHNQIGAWSYDLGRKPGEFSTRGGHRFSIVSASRVTVQIDADSVRHRFVCVCVISNPAQIFLRSVSGTAEPVTIAKRREDMS